MIMTNRLALSLAAILLGSTQISLAEPDKTSTLTNKIDLIGINLSAAGFSPNVLPGKNGQHYFFPEKNHFKYYSEKNIRLIRFFFLWERAQHNLNAKLDSEYIGLIKKTLDMAHQHGQKVILDMHNYARYKDNLIGSKKVPYEAYANVWRKLAETFKDHPAVYGYDIMNEPHDTQGLWPKAAQVAVDAIREVDDKTLIFIEGDRWASAWHWPKFNGDLLIKDPAKRLIYEAHLYFDHDTSGRYSRPEQVDPMIGVRHVQPFVEWLKANGQKGFLGEYGVPDDSPSMLKAMDNLLAYLNENCIPSAYWAGGPGWGKYKLAIEPVDGKDRPQMDILQKHIANSCVDIGPPQPEASTEVHPRE
nr:glycoside hydrolase family 5 protein [Azomonas macrocytogenes]